MYAPSQWETTLHCNVVSHWKGAYTKLSLHRFSATTNIKLRANFELPNDVPYPCPPGQLWVTNGESILSVTVDHTAVHFQCFLTWLFLLSGVQLCRHADVFRPEGLVQGQHGRLIIFKFMRVSYTHKQGSSCRMTSCWTFDMLKYVGEM